MTFSLTLDLARIDGSRRAKEEVYVDTIGVLADGALYEGAKVVVLNGEHSVSLPGGAGLYFVVTRNVGKVHRIVVPGQVDGAAVNLADFVDVVTPPPPGTNWTALFASLNERLTAVESNGGGGAGLDDAGVAALLADDESASKAALVALVDEKVAQVVDGLVGYVEGTVPSYVLGAIEDPESSVRQALDALYGATVGPPGEDGSDAAIRVLNPGETAPPGDPEGTVYLVRSP